MFLHRTKCPIKWLSGIPQVLLAKHKQINTVNLFNGWTGEHKSTHTWLFKLTSTIYTIVAHRIKHLEDLNDDGQYGRTSVWFHSRSLEFSSADFLLRANFLLVQNCGVSMFHMFYKWRIMFGISWWHTEHFWTNSALRNTSKIATG